MLTIEDLKKSYVQPDGVPLPVLEIAEFHADARRAGSPGGGQRLRENDPAARDRRDQPSRLGLGGDRWLGHHQVQRGPARPIPGGPHRLRLPDLQPAGRLLRLGKRALGHDVRSGAERSGPGPASLGPGGAGPPHDAQAADALRRRAAAGGRRPGPGQPPPALAGRRAHGQRRYPPPAADHRPVAGDLPRRGRDAAVGDPRSRGGPAVRAGRSTWSSSTGPCRPDPSGRLA